MECLRVLHKKLVRDVGDVALRLHSLLGVVKGECKHHLVFPQGNGVDNGGAYLLRH